MEGRGVPWTELLLLVMHALAAAALGDPPVVATAHGLVRGRRVVQPGADLPQYFAFEGIPFAAPPVGTRRFKDPEEPVPWREIINATEAGPICIQNSIIRNKVEGEEDCLFINVYTANPTESWNHRKLPVVVWIHLGYFISGWGNLDWLRPDALLKQGVVVVTFNYRLGVMGFLNTRDSQAPGNAGIKDALMALRWVQKNILAFGGDCDKVTVFGNGAGGAIVNHLLLTPQSEGLIHRAISASGVAPSAWTHVLHPRRNALALRQRFDGSCAGGDDIVTCLQSIDAHDLVEAEGSAPPADWEYRFWKTPFLPSLEAPGSTAVPLISTPPEQRMRSGLFLNIPYIVGFTSAESTNYLWISGVTKNSSQWAYIEENFNDVFVWAMPPGLRTTAAVTKMRKFYLGNRTLLDAENNLDTVERFVQMCSDLFVRVAVVSTARLMTQSHATVYLYEFAYEESAPFLKDNVYDSSGVPGVTHGDDLVFLLELAPRGPGAPPRNVTPEDKSVRERWVRLFTNFAKTGKPTPRFNLNHPTWKPYTLEEESYLHMDKNFTIKNHVLGKRIIFWRQLAQCQTSGVCEQNPVVHTEQGEIRGQQKQSVAGCTYYSWNGIPYARPPVGELRFKDAQSPKPWLSVRDALQDGNICPQPSVGANFLPDGDTSGNEDCLYMNVYSPQLPTWLVDSLPVLAFIHGGAFVTGSSSQNGLGPDYIVCENVIMVSFNYRLGVLGFLYLDEAAPGNAGLKDQVMAQRWVQKNIAAFLGQPSEVTLSGQSAGGAAVHLNVLSPLTKGLIRRAISQSGNALDRWAIQTAPAETSQRLATAVNCSRNDSFQTAKCLREVPFRELILAALGPAFTDFDRNRLGPFTFVPTNDLPVPGVELFLHAPAIEIVKTNAYHPVPFLTGFTSRESFLDLVVVDFRQAPQASALDASWDTKILPELSLPDDGENNEEALRALRQFYMDGKPLTNDTLLGFFDMLTDIQFGKAVYFCLKKMAEANKQTLHQYIFDVNDAFNFLKILLNATNIPGASHAEDLPYIFHMDGLPEVPENSTAALARRRMVRLWTNYVKFGDPTPSVDPLLQGVDWKPYTKNRRNYLYIGGDLYSGEDLYNKRDQFWKQFYRQYGHY